MRFGEASREGEDSPFLVLVSMKALEISHIAISLLYDVTKRNLSDVCEHFQLVYLISLSDQKEEFRIITVHQ